MMRGLVKFNLRRSEASEPLEWAGGIRLPEPRTRIRLSAMITGHKMIKFRILACLLSLVIVATAVDTIPDPPAIQSKSGLSCLVLGRTCHVAGPADNATQNRSVWALRHQVRPLGFVEAIKDVRPSRELNLVCCATDTSPPYSFLS